MGWERTGDRCAHSGSQPREPTHSDSSRPTATPAERNRRWEALSPTPSDCIRHRIRAWGSRGRRFKSGRPDQKVQVRRGSGFSLGPLICIRPLAQGPGWRRFRWFGGWGEACLGCLPLVAAMSLRPGWRVKRREALARRRRRRSGRGCPAAARSGGGAGSWGGLADWWEGVWADLLGLWRWPWRGVLRAEWAGEGSQPYLGARALIGPGHMMMDGVAPAGRGCGRSVFCGRPPCVFPAG